MRTLRLARIAAEAEGLRLRAMARRRLNQVILGAVACLFALCALAIAHFAGWLALVTVVRPLYAALVLLGIDVVIAAVVGLLAGRSSPSRAELDAMLVRDQAKQQLAVATATAAAIGPISRMLGLRGLPSVIVGALAARYLSRG
jgi:hypothetical protein